MTSPYDTLSLVTLLKNSEFVPTSQNTLNDEDFVSLLNTTFQTDICSLILKTFEEFFVKSKDFSVTASTEYIEIPPEAMFMRVREVYAINQNGLFYILPRIQPENLSGQPFGYNGRPYGGPGYYLKQNRIVFYPSLQNAGTVRVDYFRRPNILTVTSNSANIVSIDIDANSVTLDNILSEWDVGTHIDAIHSYQPFDFAQDNLIITAIDGLTVSFADVSNLSVGDVLTNAGYSIFIQYVPIEAQAVIMQGTCVRIMQGQSDGEAYKIAQQIYIGMKTDLLESITPRVVGQSRIIGGSTNDLWGSMGRNYSYNRTW